MKGLLPTRAARAWFVVALVGLVVVVLVLALGLTSRLGAGQDLVDAASPAFTSERVAGERAGIDYVSDYVDLADPIMTTRGGGSREIATLIRYLSRATGLSQRRVAAALRREAPHTEALLRSLPLSRAAREVPRFTGYLATVLNTSEEGVAAEVEDSFPRLAQALTALPAVTTGWNDVPGVDGLTRFGGAPAVKTVPDVRDYLKEDLVASIEQHAGDVRDVAAHGGIGSIARWLLVLGVVLLGFGLWQVRRSRDAPPGRLAWGIVVAVGALVLGLVGIRQYVPRLHAADRVVTDLDPAFTQPRVEGTRAGADMLHQAVLLGDPIATKRGGASAEFPALLRFVNQRTGIKRAQALAAMRRRAPHLTALLQSAPLSASAAEIPHLLTYLGKRTKLKRAELIGQLKQRTPALAAVLLTVRPVAIRWNSVPGTAELTRFDGDTPVRTMPAFDQYLSGDVVPVLEQQRASFRDLADPWPPLNVLAPLMLIVGALVLVYGLVMMRFAVPRR